jgi:hypothetical protein
LAKVVGANKVYAREYKYDYATIIDVITDFWFAYNAEDINQPQPNIKASNEIKSILKIAADFPNEQIRVHLLATDSPLSVIAAELIASFFPRFRNNNIKEVLFSKSTPSFPKQSECDYVVKDLIPQAYGFELQNMDGVYNLQWLLDKITSVKLEKPISGNPIPISYILNLSAEKVPMLL